tara:strand:- start:3869 stop:4252 length:384 start_codon:yes stop_codon:yes gene_type:complete
MSKVEFHQACNTDKILSNKGSYTKSEIEEELHFGFDYSGSPLEGKKNYISLAWTEDGLLWRIQIDYTKSKDILKGIALKNVLSDKFRNIEIQESKGQYSTTYSVVLIDEKVAGEAQLKIAKDIIPTL